MQEQIKSELKKAMLDRDAEKTNTLRMLSSALTNEIVSETRISSGKTPETPLTDEEVLKVIKREVKKRKDSIEQYVSANREDLAENERAELKILEEFLPPQMTKEEIRAKIAEYLVSNPVDPTKKGQFVGQMIKEFGDSADGQVIKSVIDELIK